MSRNLERGTALRSPSADGWTAVQWPPVPQALPAYDAAWQAHSRHSCDGVTSVVYYGDVDNMLSLRVVALMIQTHDTVSQGPHHRPSGWLLLPWPSFVVVTATPDHSPASWSSMIESKVEDTIDVVCKAPHW